MIAVTELKYGYPLLITIDLGVMAQGMLRVEGWGECGHHVSAGKSLDVWRRGLNVEHIGHGQDSY